VSYQVKSKLKVNVFAQIEVLIATYIIKFLNCLPGLKVITIRKAHNN